MKKYEIKYIAGMSQCCAETMAAFFAKIEKPFNHRDFGIVESCTITEVKE